MRKIFILTDQLYQFGGIEQLTALKANYWTKHFGYHVSVITTEHENKPKAFSLAENVKHIDLAINYDRTISYFSKQNISKLRKNLTALKNILREQHPDYLIVASHIPLTYILPFIVPKGIRIVKEFHFSKFFLNKSTKSIKLALFNYIESLYHKRVVLSPEEASFYQGGNVVVIPNPIITRNTFLVEKQNIAVAVARFAPVKRLELILEVWKHFSSKYPNWELHIYGDYNNAYGKQILTRRQELGIETSVLLKGKTQQVQQDIAHAKVLLLTSEQECFPMVLLEAHSVGVPVIAFDCPTGPRNIITQAKDGFLIENNQVETFAEKLKTLAQDQDLQSSMAANSLANANKYSIEKVMEMWKTQIFEDK